MAIDFDYTASVLMAMSGKLKEYDSLELQMIASTLTNVGAEIRKLAPPVTLIERLNKMKPEPRKFDDADGDKVPLNPTPPPSAPPTHANTMTVEQRLAAIKAAA